MLKEKDQRLNNLEAKTMTLEEVQAMWEAVCDRSEADFLLEVICIVRTSNGFYILHTNPMSGREAVIGALSEKTTEANARAYLEGVAATLRGVYYE